MTAPYDDAAWAALVNLQDGVVSRQDCRDHGITDDQIRRRLKERSWRRLHQGVFATHRGPLSHRAQVIAAITAVRRRAVASHESALFLASGGTLKAPSKIHVAVLEGTRVTAPSGVVLHWLPDLGMARVQWSSCPPQVRVEQATLDVVHGRRNVDGRVAIISQVIGARLTTIDRLREALADRPRMRDRQLVEDVLSDVSVGARSPLEVRDLRNDRAHGLLAGRRQVVAKRDGRHDWLDVVFSGNGLHRPVVKELDGRLGHKELDGKWRDMRRDNAAEVRGQSHLRYGWHDLAGEPCAVAGQTHTVLTRNGWSSPLRRCGPGCAAVPA
jgi:hypothetical protein